jgi:hypothetical protein
MAFGDISTQLATPEETGPMPLRPAFDDVLRLARTQHGMVTRQQLLGLGTSGRMIDIRTRNRRLLPVADGVGVFAVGRPVEGPQAICMAAVLVAGEGSLIAGKAAADLWGFIRHQGVIEVIQGESRRPREIRLDGDGVVGRHRVVVRRTRHLPDADQTRRHGIPVLNVARLFLDLVATLDDDDLYKAFKEADMKGYLNQSELFRCAGLGKGWTGIKRFRKLVERRHPDMKDARSFVEGLLADICAADDELERPLVNRRKGKYFPDFFFPTSGLLVEVEGAETHAGRLAFLDDTRRENILRENVRQLIRFSSEEITNERDRVLRLIKRENAKCLLLKSLE